MSKPKPMTREERDAWREAAMRDPGLDVLWHRWQERAQTLTGLGLQDAARLTVNMAEELRIFLLPCPDPR